MDVNLWYMLKQNIAEYVYNLTGETIASAAVYYIVVMSVMLVLLFLVAWKRPGVQLEDMTASTASGEQKPVEAVAVKYCPNCGTELELDSAFCTNCGVKQM